MILVFVLVHHRIIVVAVSTDHDKVVRGCNTSITLLVLLLLPCRRWQCACCYLEELRGWGYCGGGVDVLRYDDERWDGDLLLLA